MHPPALFVLCETGRNQTEGEDSEVLRGCRYAGGDDTLLFVLDSRTLYPMIIIIDTHQNIIYFNLLQIDLLVFYTF